ncbi:MAG: thioesterase family protein [Opitutaceae bacterium]
MPFIYQRTIHFPDTDAAGVVFFATYLSICHEAYEEALAAAGIDIRRFFSDTEIVMPISRSEAQYLRPLHCGDKLSISVSPDALSETSYVVNFEMTKLGSTPKLVAKVRTEHVCIASSSWERQPLPAALVEWIKRA